MSTDNKKTLVERATDVLKLGRPSGTPQSYRAITSVAPDSPIAIRNEAADDLARVAVEVAGVLPLLWREHASLVPAVASLDGPIFDRCPRRDGSCACGANALNERLAPIAAKLGIPWPPEGRSA